MDTNSVKQAVVESYGKLAKSRKNRFFSKLFSCCDVNANSQSVAEHIGYSKEEIQQAPASSNLGVGCGNPSSIANIKADDTVVDLGSGGGFDAFIISSQVGEMGKVIGIDLSDEMLDLARRNAQAGGYRNTEFIKGDIESLPLDEGVADHVISNCVINLSLQKDKVFKEAYRVLKVGGQLAISDIVLERELPALIEESLAGHIACISGAERLESYMKYIEEAGFRKIEVVSKSAFPLELMLQDPQVLKLAETMNFDLSGEEARDIASRVISVSVRAIK